MKLKKIVKYLLRTLLIIMIVVAALPFALYIPAVQRFAIDKATSIVSEKLGMQLSVKRFGLFFPLRLNIQELLLQQNSPDTLFYCQALDLDIAPWPLLRKEVTLRELLLSDAVANYRDSTGQLELHARLHSFLLTLRKADLARQEADISLARLNGAQVNLILGATPPDTTASDSTSTGWKIQAHLLKLNNVDFRMDTRPQTTRLLAHIGTGKIENGTVDLTSQEVSVDNVDLKNGQYSYLTSPTQPSDTTDKRPAVLNANEESSPRIANADTSITPPWSISVNRLSLSDNTVAYGIQGTLPQPGFDPQYIALSALNLTIDSLRNRGSEIDARIGNLSFTERSGLQIRNMGGQIHMDSVRLGVSQLFLETAHSTFRADAEAGADILKMSPEASLQMNCMANIALEELLLFLPDADPLLRSVIAGKSLLLESRLSGTLGNLTTENRLDIPGHLRMTASGSARNITRSEKMASQLQFNSDLISLNFLKVLLPDSTLRNRIAIPAHIALNGNVGITPNDWATRTSIHVDNGTLVATGRMNPKRENYDINIVCDSFPVGQFLPHDSLGLLTFTLNAEGQGFDPLLDNAASHLALDIPRCDYRGFKYQNIGFNATLADHRLQGKLSSQNEGLQARFDIRGSLDKTRQAITLSGLIDTCNLHRMHLSEERIKGRLTLDLSAEATSANSYRLHAAIDSIEIWTGWKRDALRPLTLSALADSSQLQAGFTSGDLELLFYTPVAMDSLTNSLARSIDTLSTQIRRGRFDMDKVCAELPPLDLRITAGDNNIVNNFLKTKRMAFRSMTLDASHQQDKPFTTQLTLLQLATEKIVLDSVHFGLRQNGTALDYLLRLRNSSVTRDNIALIALYGNIVQNKALVNLLQTDRSGKEGFRFGLQATLADSTVTLSMFPAHPTLGFETWDVNPGNYISYRLNRELHANFILSQGDRRFALQSSARAGQGSIALGIAGIDIGATLGLFPGAPPVAGTLNSDIVLKLNDTPGEAAIQANGHLSIGQLAYNGNSIGDTGLAFNYRLDSAASQQADAKLLLNEIPVVNAHVTYAQAEKDHIHATVEIPGLPLSAANAFLPPQAVQLAGTLKGNVEVVGDPARPAINGEMQFAGTDVRIPMIGTTFGLSENKITVTANLLRFDNYQIVAPNKQAIVIDGNLNLADLGAITTDLTVKARDFQFVRVDRNAKSDIYGTAFMDLNTTVKGPLDNLLVRGGIALLGGTDITYVMKDSPLEVKNSAQEIVSFVSFSDTTTVFAADSVPMLRMTGIDIQMNVNVDNSTRLGVDLSEDGKNRIELQGGGNLTYTMNPLGDTRFSGRYVVSGGTVRYNPPIISQKVFDITPGSYVEWTGNLADPSFNITAVESVRTTLTMEDNTSRSVKFDISINIRNTLETLAITFDLSAPEDLTIQNQLASLTPEQRANQAMGLLIYNTYTGPGTTAKVDSGNALDTFIERQLNQWAQNNLKGVDLSFGIDSYDETATGGTQRTDYSYKLSKNFFNDRIRAIIGGKFSTDADPTENLKENLIDDIALEYRLTKRDNMFLRIFRHTGYESILEGEVTETGVGFVIRKKMLRFWDLFRFAKNKAQQPATTTIHEK